MNVKSIQTHTYVYLFYKRLKIVIFFFLFSISVSLLAETIVLDKNQESAPLRVIPFNVQSNQFESKETQDIPVYIKKNIVWGDGGQDVGGGSFTDGNFRYLGYQLLERLRLIKAPQSIGISLKQFEEVLRTIRPVVTKDRFFNDKGDEYFAIYDRDMKVIIFNEELWGQHSDLLNQQLVLYYYGLFIQSDWTLEAAVQGVQKLRWIHIVPKSDNIYHIIDFNNKVLADWVSESEPVALVESILMDNIPKTIAFEYFPTEQSPLTLSYVVSDEMLQGKRAYYALSFDSNYLTAEEIQTAKKCHQLLVERSPINFIKLGEKGQKIIDCGFYRVQK